MVPPDFVPGVDGHTSHPQRENNGDSTVVEGFFWKRSVQYG